MHIITLILLSVFLNSSAQISMKKGMMIVGEITGGVQGFVAVLPNMITNIYLWISAICYMMSIVLWLVVLSKTDVSYAYPFLSIGYVLSVIVGYFAFHEAVTSIRVIGIAVICVGVVLISRSWQRRKIYVISK